MSKKIVIVNNNFDISFFDMSDEEFASSDGKHSPSAYVEILKSFQEVLEELNKMDGNAGYRSENAYEFLRVHGTWLHNLAQSGFAVDCTQYRRE